jgi:hypothetical protein
MSEKTDGVTPTQAPSGPNPLDVSEAVHAAAAAIYFNDSSDYERALWTVLRKLAPRLAEVMETDPGGAYLRAKDGVMALGEAEPCWCDKQGIGEPGVSCGDCPTRDYKRTAGVPASDPQTLPPSDPSRP